LKAAALYGINDLRIEDVPRPRLTLGDEVLIGVGSVGVYGSDLHYPSFLS
jgi:L-gulonate 5-dehydrogenase